MNFLKSLVITGVIGSTICLLAKDENVKSKAPINKGTKSMTSAKTPKIAYVNVHKIITVESKHLSSSSAEWQDHFNKLQNTIAPADAEIRSLAEKFEKGKKEFMDLQNSKLASEAALKQKYEEVAKFQMDLQQRQYERNQFTDSELNKAHMQVMPKIEKAIKSLRQSQGWDLVLRGESVIDADTSFDLTQQALDILNKEYADEKNAKELASKKSEENKPNSTWTT